MPREVIPSAICLDFTAESSVMGDNPAFSARAIGMSSSASAKLRTAYYVGKSTHTDRLAQPHTQRRTVVVGLLSKGALIRKPDNCYSYVRDMSVRINEQVLRRKQTKTNNINIEEKMLKSKMG